MKIEKRQLRISIISECNMKCVYCHNEGNTEMVMITKEQIKEIIEKFNGVESIRITGGEPLISPYVEDICQMLTEDYGISVEINTNGIEIKKLIKMINNGWIKKVVVGLDYYDKSVSKNSSVGESSEFIKNNILEIYKTGCEVCIDTVYSGEDENIEKIIRWAIDNNIEIRVIEIVKNKVDEEYSNRYINFEKKIKSRINLDWHLDGEMKELFGFKNGKIMIKFYHSLCRIGACEICKKLPIRITSSGNVKSCILKKNN